MADGLRCESSRNLRPWLVGCARPILYCVRQSSTREPAAMTCRGRFVVAAAAITLILSGALQAIYVKPDLQNVPVARLVSHLERELATDPKSADVHLRLARLYAMAYAANAEQLQATVVAGRTYDEATPDVFF